MPPKRKARPLPAEEAPPLKRVTRSRAVLVETQPETERPSRVTRSRTTSHEPPLKPKRAPASVKPANKPQRVQRTRSTRAAAREPSPAASENSEQGDRPESPAPEAPKPVRKRGRAPAKSTKAKPAKAVEPERRSTRSRNVTTPVDCNTVQDQPTDESTKELPKRRGRPPRNAPKPRSLQASPAPQASTSKLTLEQTELHPDDKTRRPSTPLLDNPPARPATPVRAMGSRASGTPRFIVEVLVNTPNRQLRRNLPLQNGTRSTRGSPLPRGSSTGPVLGATQVRERSPSSAPSESPEDILGDDGASVPPESAGITPSTSFLDDLPPPDHGSPSLSDDVAPLDHQSTSLPTKYHVCLEAQKRLALKQLRSMPVIDETTLDDGAEDHTTNDTAFQQLRELIKGTVDRGEGNSCFLTGPRGSGKTQLVEQAISALEDRPIVIRLSGHVETNDRLAVREIVRQLSEQTGKSMLSSHQDTIVEDEEENPFLDTNLEDDGIALPPPAHLLALISTIPSLSRPTIIIIDAVDLFALHARQALLYCLFDTAQSCRVGAGTKGIAIVGVTPRIDTINTLEKRVKSRFSGRIFRTACVKELKQWTQKARTALCARVTASCKGWPSKWEASVDAFLRDEEVNDIFKETFALTRDVRVLNRMLISPILALRPASPFLTPDVLRGSAAAQRCPTKFSFLATLAYPSICLLIAAMHARTSGHDIFTFEMLHESFRDQLRATQSAPVHVEGGGIGMVSCDREVLIAAYEQLIALRVFTAAAPTAIGTAKGYMRYRCALDRMEVKEVVTQTGQLNLRKWFSKS